MYPNGKTACYKGVFFFKSPIITSVKSQSKSTNSLFSMKLDKLIPKFIWTRKCPRIGNIFIGAAGLWGGKAQ